ncbi:MAG: ribonuclease HII [Chloroflexi bacterium]|nr:ribonuclease HII [Chloroflexota bacterium]
METPTLDEERALMRDGYHRIAGLDEAGRGALAGPVVAAALMLPLEDRDHEDILSAMAGVRDSKMLTPQARQALFPHILRFACAVGVGLVWQQEIDAFGIVAATRRAMTMAVRALPIPPDHLIVDSLTLPQVCIPQRVLIRADSSVLSVACASIVAKVVRDHLMTCAEATYSGYGFSQHKGYGTPQHLRALAELGPCALHRLSFAPLRGVSPTCAENATLA